MGKDLVTGLYETVVTETLAATLKRLDDDLITRGALSSADAADRIAKLVSEHVRRVLEGVKKEERADTAVRVARLLIDTLNAEVGHQDGALDRPIEPATVLTAIGEREIDGGVRIPDAPLIPLLDTTLLTNAPGEPRVGNQVQREIASADAIDLVMAFVRRSGIVQVLDALTKHRARGKRLRVLTTTYTGSTEGAALDELVRIGAEVKVSYDISLTRLHAKAWIFHRDSGFSTAYVGSSNLTHSAQNSGMEWNVRVSASRNPDVLTKIDAVFESYWQNHDFVDYDPAQFRAELGRILSSSNRDQIQLSPIEVEAKPFQERLLELIEVSRQAGHHRNLLVSATGTGKTVMAAIDYARLRRRWPHARLLFVAHRREILQQSLATFRQVIRDFAFGDLWLDGHRPASFDHVFASIQTLRSQGLADLPQDHFDVVIVDEFHHAAASSYEALLTKVQPRELLGLTATPERADGLPILHWFEDRIAAEFRLWDAIEQHRLTPFAYYGIHDGIDLTDVPWRRGQGYDTQALGQKYVSNDSWARLVYQELERHVDDVSSIRCLGFCVNVEHARFMAAEFVNLGVPSVAVWGKTPDEERSRALADLAAGRIRVVFSVDLFNEGVDVPAVDALLLLRPTESATLFLQQLGRGLRLTEGKTLCTVLDFVGTHRREFRFDLRYRALLGGTRRTVEQAIEEGFPFLPAGCHMELDRVAQAIVLQSVRNALPSRWPNKVAELRMLHRQGGPITLGTYLNETGLELSDVYTNGRGWSQMLQDAGALVESAGDHEGTLRLGVGRMLHIDDRQRLDSYLDLLSASGRPDANALSNTERRLLRMLVTSVAYQTLRTSAWKKATLQQATDMVWKHPQVVTELRELMQVLTDAPDHLQYAPMPEIPLQVHARYTRLEMLAAVGVDEVAKTREWWEGVLDVPAIGADLLVITLDKSSSGFSPTTRYRDYAISPKLIHWESQAQTPSDSDVGRRYQHHVAMGRTILLFARETADDRAFWFLGPATYISHEGERPMAVTWQLETPLSGDLFAKFAAAVA